MSPKVIFIAGGAASGKSYFAKALSDKEGLVTLDLDDRLQELIANDPKHVQGIGMELFLEEIREFRYNDLVARAVVEVKAGRSVALVAPFTTHIRDLDLWQRYIEPLTQIGVTPTLYWIYISPELQIERLIERGEQRDLEKIASPATLGEYVARKAPAPPAVPFIQIDGSKPFTV